MHYSAILGVKQQTKPAQANPGLAWGGDSRIRTGGGGFAVRFVLSAAIVLYR
jgi:hypothetical protein